MALPGASFSWEWVVPSPSLLDVLAEPGRALTLDPQRAKELLVEAAPAIEALRLAAAAPNPGRNDAGNERGDATDLLTPAEAANILSLTVKQLYRRVQNLPGVVRLGKRTLRFDRTKLEAFLRAQGRASHRSAGSWVRHP